MTAKLDYQWHLRRVMANPGMYQHHPSARYWLSAVSSLSPTQI